MPNIPVTIAIDTSQIVSGRIVSLSIVEKCQVSFTRNILFLFTRTDAKKSHALGMLMTLLYLPLVYISVAILR